VFPCAGFAFSGRFAVVLLFGATDGRLAAFVPLGDEAWVPAGWFPADLFPAGRFSPA
jgi:hypothetical protein